MRMASRIADGWVGVYVFNGQAIAPSRFGVPYYNPQHVVAARFHSVYKGAMIRKIWRSGAPMSLAQHGHDRPYVTSSRSKYIPPKHVERISLDDLLSRAEAWKGTHQTTLDFGNKTGGLNFVYYAGDLSLLARPCVSVVGTRKVTPTGAARARRLGKGLANAGIVVMSGLATGVDTEALTAAIDAGGRVIGVIGTPIDKAYPIANSVLQEIIYREHLLISQFEPGSPVHPSHFPVRNRLMAGLSAATVIVEATDGSGTLHQAAECTKLGRWLFIAQSVIANPDVTWPSKFLGYKTTVPLKEVADITSRIAA
jgi:DNA processing protein